MYSTNCTQTNKQFAVLMSRTSKYSRNPENNLIQLNSDTNLTIFCALLLVKWLRIFIIF